MHEDFLWSTGPTFALSIVLTLRPLWGNKLEFTIVVGWFYKIDLGQRCHSTYILSQSPYIHRWCLPIIFKALKSLFHNILTPIGLFLTMNWSYECDVTLLIFLFYSFVSNMTCLALAKIFIQFLAWVKLIDVDIKEGGTMSEKF